MAGRKLLYMLRSPLVAGDADTLLPAGTSSTHEDEISVVLLDATIADHMRLPGRTFVLQESHDTVREESTGRHISYADLLGMVLEADSTIVI
jgi:hypothetical protein